MDKVSWLFSGMVPFGQQKGNLLKENLSGKKTPQHNPKTNLLSLLCKSQTVFPGQSPTDLHKNEQRQTVLNKGPSQDHTWL